MTEQKPISHCAICQAPVYIENKKIKKTCSHTDQDEVKYRLGL
jgi:predicted nucleic acid-binding Zn ribbon protein